MSDDVEQRLSRVTPRGVRAELRGQVLEAVASELQGGGSATVTPTAQRDSPWLRRAAIAVAASLLMGIGLNVWASKASERHLARLFGPPPVSKGAMEIAKTVEEITDAETGQWVYRRFTMPRRPGDGAAAYAKYCDAVKKLINELQTVSKDSYHETPHKDPEMDGNRTGCIGGDTSYCQLLVRLDYRCTA